MLTAGRFVLDSSLAGATPAWKLRVRSDAADVVQAYPELTYSGKVYLSGAGSDSNAGMTNSDPVQTFDRAKEILMNELGGKGQIVVCGTVTVDGTEEWFLPSGASMLKDSDSGSAAGINVGGNLALTDISISGMQISTSGALTIGSGAWISGPYSGAVQVRGGTLTLDGGTITSDGWGVQVSGGTFTMKSGSISSCYGGNVAGSYYAGGVGVTGGAFVMNGGSIKNNRLSYSTRGAAGV